MYRKYVEEEIEERSGIRKKNFIKSYLKYFCYIASTLIITALGDITGRIFINAEKESIIFLVLILISFILMFIFAYSNGGVLKKIIFFIEPFLIGLCLSYAKSVNIILCLIITFLIVSISIFLGYFSYEKIIKKDEKIIKKMGKFLFVCLIVSLISNLLNIYLNLPEIILPTIILFSFYIFYDSIRFKQEILSTENCIISDDKILFHVMKMYLDIMNIYANVQSINDDNN